MREGGFIVVENTIVRTAAGIPLDVTSHDAATPIVTLRNSTLVRTGGGDFPAIRIGVQNAVGNATTNVNVSSVIARGFLTGYDRQAPVAGNVGDANLSISHSNFPATGVSYGDGTLTLASNIDADPLFVSAENYRLRAGSPSIDSGNPAAGDPLVDFDGLSRPFDGNGDGVAVRDQGAFEYRPPAPSDPGNGGGTKPPPAPPPSTAPVVSDLRLVRAPTAGRTGRLALTLSKPARVVVTLKRIRKSGRSPSLRQRFAQKRAGTHTLALRKRTLRPGRYRLTVVAIDAAGKRSKPKQRTFRVRR